jgi:polyribonucleotide nucleotidyltransferase
MIECDAKDASAELVLQAFEIASQEIIKICNLQKEFVTKLSIEEKTPTISRPSQELLAYVKNILSEDKLNSLTGNTKVPFNSMYYNFEKEVLEICKPNIED